MVRLTFLSSQRQLFCGAGTGMCEYTMSRSSAEKSENDGMFSICDGLVCVVVLCVLCLLTWGVVIRTDGPSKEG